MMLTPRFLLFPRYRLYPPKTNNAYSLSIMMLVSRCVGLVTFRNFTKGMTRGVNIPNESYIAINLLPFFYIFSATFAVSLGLRVNQL